MKQLLLVLLLAIGAFAQTTNSANPASTDDKTSKLVQMQNDWLKAGSDGNNAAIRALIDEHWMAMAPSGYIMHSSDFEAPESHSRLPKLTMQKTTVEFFGNTAVLMAHLVTEKENGPEFNLTSVFQNKLGKWEMIATHLSGQAEHAPDQNGTQ